MGVAAASILLLSAHLRLRALGAVGFGSDEAVYAGQAQALAGESTLWPSVRAHPPLLSLLLSLAPGHGGADLPARMVAVGFGLVGVATAVVLGALLEGQTGGLMAGLIAGTSPYHVAVTRQLLVDVPMAALAAVALCLFVTWLRRRRLLVLLLSAAALGLAVLAKETAVLVAAGLACAVVADPRIRPHCRDATAAVMTFAGVVASYPLWLLTQPRGEGTAAGLGIAAAYLEWQLERPANADWTFYLHQVAPAAGSLLVLGGIATFDALRRQDPRLLPLVWVAWMPIAFFLLWPVKGYSYLLVAVAPLATLAACTFSRSTRPGISSPPIWRTQRGLAFAVASVLCTAQAFQAIYGTDTKEGKNGVPAVREAAYWLAGEPEGTTLTGNVAIANIVRYYARRPIGVLDDNIGTTVNPAYHQSSASEPPKYLVWDQWTASEAPGVAGDIVYMARRHRARVAHIEQLESPQGARLPAVVIFEVPTP